MITGYPAFPLNRDFRSVATGFSVQVSGFSTYATDTRHLTPDT